MLGDDKIALVINRFKWFHDNRKNRRCGGQKEGYFNNRDPNHFIIKNNHEYISNKHKSRGRTFDKKMLKKQYCKTTKAYERAFLASLNDIDSGDDTSSSSSDNESKSMVEDKLNGLCFLTDTIKKGFCGMVLDNDTTGNNDDHVSGDDLCL